MGVYCHSLSQNGGIDELFCRLLGDISGSVALVLTEDFKFPDINW